MSIETIKTIEASITRDLQHLSTISNNVANINTPGYLQVNSFDTALETNEVGINKSVNIKNGGIRTSSRALDFAIQDSGFFVVALNEEMRLTRYGRFHIDADGNLKHVSGALLMGTNGPIHVDSEDVSVSANGDVNAHNQLIDRIQVVNVSQLALSENGAGLYVAVGPTATIDSPVIKQFSINASNVDPTIEMTKVTELNRHVQSLQKVAAAIDQMLNIGINEFGRK